jgi:hypothetical protein
MQFARYINITMTCFDFWSDAEADALVKLFDGELLSKTYIEAARDKKATIIEISPQLQIEGTLVKKLDQYANTIDITVRQLARDKIMRILNRLKYHSIIDVSVGRDRYGSKSMFRGWFRAATKKFHGGTTLKISAADEPNTKYKDNLFLTNRGDVPKDFNTFYNKIVAANNTAITGWDSVKQQFKPGVTDGQIKAMVMGTVGQAPAINSKDSNRSQIGFGPGGPVSDAAGQQTEILLYRKEDGKQKQQFKTQEITIGNITNYVKMIEDASTEDFIAYWDWGRFRFMEKKQLDILAKKPIRLTWEDGLMEEPDLNQAITEVKLVYNPKIDIGNVLEISQTQLLVVELTVKFASYSGAFYSSLKCIKVSQDTLWLIKNSLMLEGTPSAMDYLDHNRIGPMMGRLR